MGILMAILAVLSIICMALGVVTIMNLSSEPLISANLTWQFWMALAGFFMLCVIAISLISRGRNYGE